ncbi:conserved hypothetical protein [Ricinus communis]|uniref:Reverse transcriptase zinc-binding domain-containing protein n=1 Tax=Ricinus communis TaxID=3988 RepID=B9RNP0_RICCO|nr:conserved hypothetical protein [Ricinus communis]
MEIGCTGNNGQNYATANLQEVWMILSNPDSLTSRVLKGRYFVDSDILHSEVGYNASWAWKSLLAGRELLKSGLRWQVGNGRTIKAFQDPWIPTPISEVINLSSSPNMMEQAIDYFIDSSSKAWKISLLHRHFQARQWDPAIMLGRNIGKARLHNFYHPTLDGSTYRKCIFPTRSRSFCKLLSNAIPVGSLVGLTTSGESLPWALFHQQSNSHLSLRFWDHICAEFNALQLDKECYKILAHTLWQVWKSRNKLVFGNIWQKEIDVVSQVAKDIHEFKQASKDNILPRNLRGHPSLPPVEVESDWIVYLGIADPFILESLALRDSVAWASMKSWRKVMFSDAA